MPSRVTVKAPAKPKPSAKPVRRLQAIAGGIGKESTSHAPDSTVQRASLLRQTAQWASLGILVMLGIYALSWGSFFLIPATMVFMFGMTLGPMVDWLERRGWPAYLVAILFLLLLAAAFYAAFLLFAIPLEEWSRRVPDIMSKAQSMLYLLRGPLDRLQELSKSVQDATNGGEKPIEVAVRDWGLVTGFLATLPAIFAQILILVGGLYFFLANRSRIRAALLLAAEPGLRYRIARVIRDTEFFLSHYVASITLVNIGLGIATGVAMWAIGLPSPGLWGTLAAVLNFIPFLGPTLLIVIIAGVALVTFDSVSHVLLAPALALGLHLIESQFVTPIVLGHRLTLNPFAVFMSLAFWLWLWGPIGGFLAVPLLILGTVIWVHYWPTRMAGGPATFGKPALRSPMAMDTPTQLSLANVKAFFRDFSRGKG